jgi:hypothetical protein
MADVDKRLKFDITYTAPGMPREIMIKYMVQSFPVSELKLPCATDGTISPDGAAMLICYLQRIMTP